ncbi:hypothetical protein D9C73_002661 [Collichthys lucidus]|uniref:Uncharacterized protein n=1 Tax=Collichthys lucidus TaxID=240159 RepID=A0A4U5U4B9_COLLU|nr:hypothetical protein D9C73_002661 [Collichthys lucidus]
MLGLGALRSLGHMAGKETKGEEEEEEGEEGEVLNLSAGVGPRQVLEGTCLYLAEVITSPVSPCRIVVKYCVCYSPLA